MSERNYAHILRYVAEMPWAMLESHLAVILEVLELRVVEGERLSTDEISARINASKRGPRNASGQGAVAVIPLYGILMPRADLFMEMSGGTSMQTFQANFLDALNNPDVGSILIDVDSPGGSVEQIEETAQMIYDARSQKSVVAIANTMAASAGYYLASQASELYVTPSGWIGSIGVITAHEDVSAMQEKAGIKTTVLTAGKYKGEGNRFGPLTEEAQAAIEKILNAHYDMFTASVARGRGVDVQAVKSGFGEGRMVMAREAVAENMADGVATFDDVLSQMLQSGGTGSGAPAGYALVGAVGTEPGETGEEAPEGRHEARCAACGAYVTEGETCAKCGTEATAPEAEDEAEPEPEEEPHDQEEEPEGSDEPDSPAEASSTTGIRRRRLHLRTA